MKWHQRFSHLHERALQNMARAEAPIVTGFDYDPKVPLGDCIHCLIGKAKAHPYPSSDTKPTRIGEIIVFDLGESPSPDLWGDSYFIAGTDHFSGFTFFATLKQKSDALKYIQYVCEHSKNSTGTYPVIIRCDRGGELFSGDVKSYLLKIGSKLESSCPYAHQQNGIAERKVLTIMDSTRATLQHSQLPQSYWSLAARCVVYTRNRCVNSSNTTTTPYELWFKKRPDVSILQSFGSIAYVMVPDTSRRKKLSPRAIPLTFVGYDPHSKGYQFIDPVSLKITISDNAKFVNLHDPKAVRHKECQTSSETMMNSFTSTESQLYLDASTQTATNSTSVLVETTDEVSTAHKRKRVLFTIDKISHENSSENANEPDSNELFDVNHFSFWCEVQKWADNQESEPSMKPMPNPTTLIPNHFHEIKGRSDADRWYKACDAELAAMQSNNAWELQPTNSIPSFQKPVGCRWVFRIKYNSDGSINRYKARLVAKGYTQVEGIDYKSTFAPVICSSSLRVLLAIGASQDLHIHHIDVMTAFLLAPLNENVYMNCPPGYSQPGMVCKLKKSIYGLKQAPYIWNSLLTKLLLSNGWVALPSEPCIFTKPGLNQYIGVYVDDMTILAKTIDEITTIKNVINSAFPITDLGPIAHILGYEVKRNRECRSLTLSQCGFIKEILDISTIPHSELYPISTPLDGNNPLTLDPLTLPKHIPYRNIVGKLIYLANGTRPDIAHAVSSLCRFFNRPGPSHWVALKRLIRYIYGTRSLGIVLGSPHPNPTLSLYVDASDGDDRLTEKSRTGFIFFLDKSPILWSSSIQKLPTLSSTESELVALTEATRQNIWLRDLLSDLNYRSQSPTVTHEDNLSTIVLVKNSSNNIRTRPLNRRRYYVQYEWLTNNSIDIKHCSESDQIADILTKFTSKPIFQRHRNALLGIR